MKRAALQLLLAIFCWITGGASADEYSVQIGTYKNPELLDLANAHTIGEITQVRGLDGLTRIRIGPFTSEVDARAARSRAIDAGYTDAYVTTSTRHRSADATGGTTAAPRTERGASNRRLAAARAKIPAGQSGNIVYLDGRLHLKQENRFMPLE